MKNGRGCGGMQITRVIDWWDYGHALFDAVEFEGNVSKAPLRLSSEEVSRNSSHRPAGSGCSAGFCSAHGSWPAPHTEAMAALFLDGWQNLSLEAFHPRQAPHS